MLVNCYLVIRDPHPAISIHIVGHAQVLYWTKIPVMSRRTARGYAPCGGKSKAMLRLLWRLLLLPLVIATTARRQRRLKATRASEPRSRPGQSSPPPAR